MHIISAILLGVSTNLDNLFLGMSFGMQKRKITLLCNLLIGLFSASATCLFCYFSSMFSGFGRIPNYIGGAIIILVGIFSLFSKESERGSGGGVPLSLKESILLGTGLAINCIPVAFGAGLSGMPPWLASLSVGLLSVAVVAVGNRLGLYTSMKINGKFLNLLGGAIMILLGVIELVA